MNSTLKELAEIIENQVKEFEARWVTNEDGNHILIGDDGKVAPSDKWGGDC